jgi:hypothetical protein
MRDGYVPGALSRPATQRQMDVLAAFVAAGGSVADAAELVGIRPSTVKRHLADLRARSGFATEQLIYAGCAAGWLVVPNLEPRITDCIPRRSSPMPRRKPASPTQGVTFGAAIPVRPALPRQGTPHHHVDEGG